MQPLPTDPNWRDKVEHTIDRLERRAERGETFARLALSGWYAELVRIKEVKSATHTTLLNDEL